MGFKNKKPEPSYMDRVSLLSWVEICFLDYKVGKVFDVETLRLISYGLEQVSIENGYRNSGN